MQTGLVLRAEQRLALMPKMLQSIEILQLATVDLVGLIERELEQNEALELLRPESEVEPIAREETTPTKVDEVFDIESWKAPRASGEDDTKQAMLNNLPAHAENLIDHVRSQLTWRDLSADLLLGVEALAEHLDERGLLTLDDHELEKIVEAEMLGDALEVLQSLEPRGIGGRSTTEAMLLQLSATDPDHDLIESMLSQHLEALARNKIPEVARSLGISVEDVEGLLARIKDLNPRPCSSFAEEDVAQVHPDLVVSYDEDGQIQVVVDDLALPVLGLNEDYLGMVDDRCVSGDVKKYLREKLQSAKDLITAVQQRKATLARVGAAVMSRQGEFLNRGKIAIKPLKMSEIAEQLGLHTSTISRAIAGKYVQTDLGISSLREFFDGARGHSPKGAPANGRLAIKEHIRELIDGEDSSRPLSDDDVVALLQRRKIKVARRTVTKYRKELDIPSSWQRKRFGRER